jgi:ParB family chromosome partitioning protein
MEGTFIADYDITKIIPAPYNPRVISEESIAELRRSIATLGIVKPIIIRENNIVAGHQRVKALLAINITTAPVYILPLTANKYDEMSFNQLHNGTDLDWGEENVVVPPCGVEGFQNVKVTSGNKFASGAEIRNAMATLILKYGSWGACVATFSGKVIHAAQYALACLQLRIPCKVYYLEDSKEETAKHYLNQEYGVFSYQNLEKDPFVQTWAQPLRLTKTGQRANRAPTYENILIPMLQKDRTIHMLDFGCGRGDYVRELSERGFNIQGMEFFPRKDGKSLDMEKANRMVDALIHHLVNFGKFDVLLCDYVLNSVISKDAEWDVLNCMNIFTKLGGKIYFSGHRIEEENRKLKSSQKNTMKSNVNGIQFNDKDLFTGIFHKGYWFFQLNHTDDRAMLFAGEHGMEMTNFHKEGIFWYVEATKIAEILDEDIKLSISREFNMPYNKEKTITLNRHEEVLEALYGQNNNSL